jgi:hypothetical protein
VTQDRVVNGAAGMRFSTVGEFWHSHEHEHRLDAGSERGAFDGYLMVALVEDGKGLLADRCTGRVGPACPVTFHRVKD